MYRERYTSRSPHLPISPPLRPCPPRGPADSPRPQGGGVGPLRCWRPLPQAPRKAQGPTAAAVAHSSANATFDI